MTVGVVGEAADLNSYPFYVFSGARIVLTLSHKLSEKPLYSSLLPRFENISLQNIAEVPNSDNLDVQDGSSSCFKQVD